MLNNWYIPYDPVISEEIFYRIVDKLMKMGLASMEHCGYYPNYQDFKRGGYLRGEVSGEEPHNIFCTDNNPQNLEEISLFDILNNK